MQYKQLSAFVATMQLLVNYSRTKEKRRTLVMYCGTIKTDDLSETERKVATVFHESPAGIDSEKRLSNTK